MSSNDTYETVLTRKTFVRTVIGSVYNKPPTRPMVCRRILWKFRFVNAMCLKRLKQSHKTGIDRYSRSSLALTTLRTQQRCNKWMPTKVFNLSITNDEIINKPTLEWQSVSTSQVASGSESICPVLQWCSCMMTRGTA